MYGSSGFCDRKVHPVSLFRDQVIGLFSVNFRLLILGTDLWELSWRGWGLVVESLVTENIFGKKESGGLPLTIMHPRFSGEILGG